MAKKDFTIEYYNNEADRFFESTVSVDFSKIQEQFLKYVKPGGRILDLGCGSGRDSRAFLERGYEVVAVDGSRELAKIAGAYIPAPAEGGDSGGDAADGGAPCGRRVLLRFV